MSRRIAIVTVHGINTSGAGYSALFKRNLVKALPSDLRSRMMFREVVWADILRGRQNDFLQRGNQMRLRSASLRRLVVEALGDAAAYQKTARLDNSAYYRIQMRVLEMLEDLEVDSAEDPLVVMVGHSLGCHIISSFAWDLNRWKNVSENDFADQEPQVIEFIRRVRAGRPVRRLDTFAGFLTLGCNIPLFTFTFGPDRVYPITQTPSKIWSPAFPGRGLEAHFAKTARWTNVYSKRDPLGFPLKALNSRYQDEERIHDIEHAVEGWLSLPLASTYAAHVNYWNSGFVAKKAAELVSDLAAAEPAR